jgi:CBS-domain-containing membrane protein
VKTFVDGGCHVVSVKDPYSSILGFLDQKDFIIATKTNGTMNVCVIHVEKHNVKGGSPIFEN